MDKITINLLPPELGFSKKQKQKETLLKRVSFAVIIITLLLISAVTAVSITQRLNLNSNEKKLKEVITEVDRYKEQESLIFVLKNRLERIINITNRPSFAPEAYTLINKLLPRGILLNSINATKENSVVLSGGTTSARLLQTFIDDLLDPKKNNGKVTMVKLDSLSQSINSQLRFDITVNF